MIIKKHEQYEFEETTSGKDNEPPKSVSAVRTVHEITDTEKGIFDRDCDTKYGKNDTQTINPFDLHDDYSNKAPITSESCNSKVYHPPSDNMDLDQLIKQSTGKKYSSSWFYGDSSKNPYPTIEEQVKLSRKIASQLVDDKNRKSKGASMFFKRLKRSQKWVHEGNVNANANANDNDNCNGNGAEAEREMQRLKQELRSDTIPRLKLILDPREVLSLEKLRKTGDIVEHNIVSPDLCHNLVKDLNSPEANKGAQIFLKRKEKSEEWVVDENSCTAQLREKKREKELQAQQENAQKEWLAKKQKEKMVELEQLENIKQSLPKIKLIKSPWEASLNGNVEQAFETAIPPKKLETIAVERTKLTSIDSNVNKNFKNFNRNPKGWGSSVYEDYEQRSNSGLSLKSPSPMIPVSVSPLPSLSEPQITFDFELPRSYTVLENLKHSQKPKCAEFEMPKIEKRPHSILKDGKKCNLHRSATVNFRLENDTRPVVHFDLKNLNLGNSKLPKFKDFNAIPKIWSREPVSYL